MSERVEQIITGIIDREGGYADHPFDRGGQTRWGITEAVARMNGYTGDMRELPVSFARDIYRQQYYLRPGLDEIEKISVAIAEELMDTGVNMGPPVSIAFLQRSLNVLNRQQKLYPDIKTDGYSGHNTLAALASFLKARGKEGEAVLLKMLNALQAVRYIELAERNESQEEFEFGWIKERVT